VAIKNDMEFLVRAEVERRREPSGKAREQGACWCSLCEMDILALALNQLPPRYCHERNFGLATAQRYVADVRAAVSRAVQKVSRRPRHRPGKPLSRGEDVRMENFAQKIGSALVATALSPEVPGCACDQCQADALAIALNRYPPKYGVSYAGRESYQGHYADFIRHEVGQALTKAAAVVREHPHH
jgi:competence protein ComFB